MLVGKDHTGGEGSCWWGRIMLLGKDHAGAARWLLLQNYDFCTEKILFLHKTDPHMSVRNINRSKLYVISRPTRSHPPFLSKNNNVEIDPNFGGGPLILSLSRRFGPKWDQNWWFLKWPGSKWMRTALRIHFWWSKWAEMGQHNFKFN